MKSIQAKMTIVTFIISLVALSILGGLNYWKSRTIITTNVSNDMREKAQMSAKDVGAWLEARKAELYMISNAPMVKNGNVAEIVPFLANAVNANSAYISIGYSNLNGDVINSAGKQSNLADREYFKKAISGEAWVSDPLMSRTNGRLSTVIAVPVKADGKVVGVISGAIDMEGLAKRVLDIKMGQTGYAFIVQGDGLRIIHPDEKHAMKYNPLQDENADIAQKQVTKRMLNGETGTAIYQYQGTDKYYSFSPIPGVNWSLAITVPVAEVSAVVSTLTTVSLITIVSLLLVTALLSWWYARRLAAPIQKLENAATRIADGDISLINLGTATNDEIGRLGLAFEKMTKNLRDLIKQVSKASDQVTASSEDLATSAEQSSKAANQVAAIIGEVAGGAQKQTQAFESTAAAMQQMSESIQQVANNANAVADASVRSSNAAQNGNKTVEQAISQMDHIENTVIRTALVVTKLGDRSKEIGQIVDTISGIAGQTNLLALNAAIEAARAGEQGRGFAVVAEEVRRLAEQSQEAAKQIAVLITEIQKDTDNAVITMNEGTAEVRLGSDVVKSVGQTFEEIYNLFNEATTQIRSISAAIQQMADGSQHIVKSVQSVDAISKETVAKSQTVSAATEEQSATMEQISASSQLLAKMAEELSQVVRKFRL